ncbi:MAG: PDZ domain-containing protein, partial [Candidatus Porifericomitaceae bacterium WSBS_2022_MAG_OTU9]
MVVALTACAPVTRIPSISATAIAQEQELQNNMVIGDILERQEHLLTVAWPLLRNAAWLCPHTNSGLGLLVVNDPSIPQPRWGQDKNVAGSGGLLVAAVAPGSPADNVGLRKGDTIVAIANVNLTGRTAINDYYRLTSKLPTSVPLSLRHSRA